MSSKAPAERKPATVVTTGAEIDAAIARGKNFVPSQRVVDATYRPALTRSASGSRTAPGSRSRASCFKAWKMPSRRNSARSGSSDRGPRSIGRTSTSGITCPNSSAEFLGRGNG